MEIILKQDVHNLGFKDDVVTVRTATDVITSFRKDLQFWLLPQQKRY